MTGSEACETVGYTRDVTRPGAPAPRLVHHARGTRGSRQDDPGDGPRRRTSSGRASTSTSPGSRAAPGSASGSARSCWRAPTPPPPTDPLTDALLFNAARRQLVTEVIRPALDGRADDRVRPLRRLDAGLPGLRRRACRWTTLRALERDRDRRPRARPHDPPRPARRGRPGPEGARRRDPLRGGVRPRLPPSGPRRLPGPGRRRTGPVRGHRRRACPAVRGGRAPSAARRPTAWSASSEPRPAAVRTTG